MTYLIKTNNKRVGSASDTNTLGLPLVNIHVWPDVICKEDPMSRSASGNTGVVRIESSNGRNDQANK